MKWTPSKYKYEGVKLDFVLRDDAGARIASLWEYDGKASWAVAPMSGWYFYTRRVTEQRIPEELQGDIPAMSRYVETMARLDTTPE